MDKSEKTSTNNTQRASFGEVALADWQGSSVKKVFLKTIPNFHYITEECFQEFVKEVKFQPIVEENAKILHFYGITKETPADKYLLVLDIADEGTLRQYLNKNYDTMINSAKLEFAKEVASGIKWMHEAGVIHRDLNSANILVHEKHLKITYITLSKESVDLVNGQTCVYDILPYVEPLYVRDPDYIRDFASDIFSIGVVFWELSSGRPPFQGQTGSEIFVRILTGDRDKPIEGTPKEYVELFKSCCQYDREKRPGIQHVVDVLETTNWEGQNPSAASLPPEDKLEDCRSALERVEAIPDEDRLFLENSLRVFSQATFKTNDDSEITSAVTEWIKENGSTPEHAFNLARRYRYYPRCASLLGFSHQFGMGTVINVGLAYQWYKVGADGEDHFAQNQLGRCYFDGIGCFKDESKGFYWTKKSAEGEHPQGLGNLAHFYLSGDFVDKDEGLAFELYSKAANSGYINGLYYVGDCYFKGVGTKKDPEKGVEYFEKAAKGFNLFAQQMLAYAYRDGIGAAQDYDKAFYWYNKLAQRGNPHGQTELGRCYQQGQGSRKDPIKAFHWYSQAAMAGDPQGMINLASCYQEGYGIDTDMHMAIRWSRKAIEKRQTGILAALNTLFSW